MGLNQKQLAGELGVSQMTISRVLNNRAGVSRALRAKITDKAQASGYVYNKLAAGLRGNSSRVIGAYRYLKRKCICVPQAIALAGFSDLQMTGLLEVPLTTVREKTAEIGKMAFDLLAKKIRVQNTPCQICRLKPELVVRNSA